MHQTAGRSDGGEEILNATADIAAAFFSHNAVRQDDVTRVIRDIHKSLARIQEAEQPAAPP